MLDLLNVAIGEGRGAVAVATIVFSIVSVLLAKARL